MEKAVQKRDQLVLSGWTVPSFLAWVGDGNWAPVLYGVKHHDMQLLGYESHAFASLSAPDVKSSWALLTGLGSIFNKIHTRDSASSHTLPTSCSPVALKMEPTSQTISHQELTATLDGLAGTQSVINWHFLNFNVPTSATL